MSYIRRFEWPRGVVGLEGAVEGRLIGGAGTWVSMRAETQQCTTQVVSHENSGAGVAEKTCWRGTAQGIHSLGWRRSAGDPVHACERVKIRVRRCRAPSVDRQPPVLKVKEPAWRNHAFDKGRLCEADTVRSNSPAQMKAALAGENGDTRAKQVCAW